MRTGRYIFFHDDKKKLIRWLNEYIFHFSSSRFLIAHPLNIHFDACSFCKTLQTGLDPDSHAWRNKKLEYITDNALS